MRAELPALIFVFYYKTNIVAFMDSTFYYIFTIPDINLIYVYYCFLTVCRNDLLSIRYTYSDYDIKS